MVQVTHFPASPICPQTMQWLTSPRGCKSDWQAFKAQGAYICSFCTTCVLASAASFPRRQTGIVASLGHVHSTFMRLADWRAYLLSCFLGIFSLETGKCVRQCCIGYYSAAQIANLFPVLQSKACSRDKIYFQRLSKITKWPNYPLFIYFT